MRNIDSDRNKVHSNYIAGANIVTAYGHANGIANTIAVVIKIIQTFL